MKVKAQTTRGCKIEWVFAKKGETMAGFVVEKAGFYRVEVETAEITYLGYMSLDWQADIRDYKANGWTIQIH